MGISTTVLAVAGFAASAFSAIQQMDAAEDAAQAQREQGEAMNRQAAAQREQFELNKRQSDIENARSVRTAVRQARIARAAIINSGANAGALQSSGVEGGAGSIGSQLGGNLTYFGQMGTLNNQVIDTQIRQGAAASDAGAAQGRAAVAQQESASWGALGSLGGTVFSGAGGFKTIFGGNKFQ